MREECGGGGEAEQPPPTCSHLQVHGVLKGLQVDLGAVICPGSELHLAALLVKGEEGDVDGAGGLVDGRRYPADTTGVKQLCLGHVGDSELPVSTLTRKEGKKF